MKEINVEDLESVLATGVRLVDVREPDEYTSGHVPGALSIPLGQVPDRQIKYVISPREQHSSIRSGT